MKLSSIIGSILLFKHSGIDEKMIHNIAMYSESTENFTFNYNDIASVIYNLSDYRACFEFKNSKIVRTSYYDNHIDIFKYKFFDALSENEKLTIYKLVSLI